MNNNKDTLNDAAATSSPLMAKNDASIFVARLAPNPINAARANKTVIENSNVSFINKMPSSFLRFFASQKLTA